MGAAAEGKESSTEPTATIGLPFSGQDTGQFVEALRSIFAQNESNWRLILVADGPSRNVEVAAAITDSRVALVKERASAGLAARLNQIASLADTQLLYRMDADDIMHPDRLRVMNSYFNTHPEVDLVGSRAIMIDEQSAPRGLFRESESVPKTPAGFLRSNAFSHPTVAARTEWFRRNPYDETLKRSQDKALWLTSSGHSSFVKLQDPLLFYRVDSRLDWRRQALSSRYDRYLLGKYGVSVDASQARRLVIESHVKQRVFEAMIRLGMEARLYDRKFEALPEEQRFLAEQTLQSVLRTPIPGLD